MTELATTTTSDNRTDTLRHDGEAAVRALIVDDEDALRSTLARVLRQRGIIAETAENGFAALDMLERSSFDVVLVDVRMPGMTGPQFLQRVKAAGNPVDYLRLRALPLSDQVTAFVSRHERVYVVEQNRDGQVYDIVRLALSPELVGRVHSIRHYNGQPIPAAAIIEPMQQMEPAPA